MLLAYSKIDLYAELLDSDVPEDPHLSAELDRYFPAPLPERFGEPMREHRLRREIIATQVANNMLHGGGHHVRLPAARGDAARRASEIARAYAVARDIFEMRPQWAEIEALDNRVAAERPDRDAARGPPADRARLALAAAQPRRGRSTSAPTVRALRAGRRGRSTSASRGCSAPPTSSR